MLQNQSAKAMTFVLQMLSASSSRVRAAVILPCKQVLYELDESAQVHQGHDHRQSQGQRSDDAAVLPDGGPVVFAFRAAGLILVHNHPSGDATASASDRAVVARLSRIAADLDMHLIDALIVAGGECVSFLNSWKTHAD